MTAATRACSKPAASRTARSRDGPACAPRASPPGCASAFGDAEQRRRPVVERTRCLEVGRDGVLRPGLDEQERATRRQGLEPSGGGRGRVAQVVEGVEAAHEVPARPRHLVRPDRLEGDLRQTQVRGRGTSPSTAGSHCWIRLHRYSGRNAVEAGSGREVLRRRPVGAREGGPEVEPVADVRAHRRDGDALVAADLLGELLDAGGVDVPDGSAWSRCAS